MLVSIGGCSKNLDKTPPSSGVVLNDLDDLRSIIQRGIKYDGLGILGCGVRISGNNRYCVNIDQAIRSTENGEDIIYVVEKGVLEDPEPEEMVHLFVPRGSLKFFKYEFSKDKLNLLAESELVFCWDNPAGSCKVNTYKIGGGSELGWLVEGSYWRQGFVGSHMEAYAAFGEKIRPILNIKTGFSNQDAYGDDSGNHVILELSTQIKTSSVSSDRFSDLEVFVRGEEASKKKKTAINFREMLKFDYGKKIYDAKSVEKFYENADR